MSEDDVKVLLRIPRTLKDALKAQADAERRSMNQIVEFAIEQYLERELAK